MMSPASPQHSRAVLMLVLANFYWGLSFPVIKAIVGLHGQLVPAAGPWFSAIYTVAPRFALSVVILAVLWPREIARITRAELKQGVTIGLFAAGGMLFQNDGLQFTTASTSAFLTQFYAIMIPVWVAVRVRHNPGWLVWTCCVLVLAGVSILGNFNFKELQFGRGEWETLLSSFFFMGQILWLAKPEFATNDPRRLSFVMFATEGIVFWTLAAGVAPDVATLARPWQSGPWLGLTVVLTVFCTVGAFSLMNRWQPKITATEAGLIYCIEPIFASIMALFVPAWFSAWAGIDYPNEQVTWTLFIGGGLITLANVLLQLRAAGRISAGPA